MTRIGHHLPEVAGVVLEGLLADDDVPAAREGAEHERPGPRLLQPELDAVGVEGDDVGHRREERRARDDHALRGGGDPLVGRLDVLRREVGAVVELHAAPQVEGVLLTVGRDLPALGEVGNDRLAVPRIAADQVVVHGGLGADVRDGPRLVDVEVGGRGVDAEAQRAATPGARIGFDGGVLR